VVAKLTILLVVEVTSAILPLWRTTSHYHLFPSLSAHAFSTISQDWVLLSLKHSNRESNNPQSWLSNRFPIPHSLKSAEATAVSALNQLTLPSLSRQRTEPSPSTVLSQSLKLLSSARKIWLLNNQSVKPKRIPSVFSTTRTVVSVQTLTALTSKSVFLTSPTAETDSDQVQAMLVSVTEDDRVYLYFELLYCYCLA
jgi:hypothetical protein